MYIIYKDQDFRYNFTTGTSVPATVQLKLRSPSGIEYIVDALTEDESLGKYYYDFTDEIDEIGQWNLWSYITIDTNTYPGDAPSIIVQDEGQTIVSREFVKNWLSITDTSKDFKIDALIPVVESDYLRIRNCAWETDPVGNIKYPNGSDVTAAEMIGYRLSKINNSSDGNVSSEKIGSYSVSFDSSNLTRETIAGGGYPLAISSSIQSFVRGE